MQAEWYALWQCLTAVPRILRNHGREIVHALTWRWRIARKVYVLRKARRQ